MPQHEAFRQYEELAIGSGLRMVHKDFAIVSEKPETIATNVVDGVHILHNERGPSIRWRDGISLWHLNGVRMPRWVVETDQEKLDAKRITEFTNAEQRREFIRKVGIDRICYSMNAECVSKDGDYELLMLDIGDGRKRPYLKMLNPSIDTWHVEGVHPSRVTVQDALNFRSGLEPEEIDDVNGVDWFQQGDVCLFPKGATKFKSRPKILT